MTYGYITTWLKHKSCVFLRKLSDDFQPQGKKWLKIQPQKLPVAKFVVAGHRCGPYHKYHTKYHQTHSKILMNVELNLDVFFLFLHNNWYN